MELIRFTIRARLSDNVLHDSDVTIVDYNFVAPKNDVTENIRAQYRHFVQRGVYSMANAEDTTIRSLFEWARWDSTGEHPEIYQDICLIPPGFAKPPVGLGKYELNASEQKLRSFLKVLRNDL